MGSREVGKLGSWEGKKIRRKEAEKLRKNGISSSLPFNSTNTINSINQQPFSLNL
jgi:hypothetical protein